MKPKGFDMARVTVGAVVALLALSCTAEALQSTTTPNAAFFTYNLAPSTFTQDYYPPTDVSVGVMACSSTVGDRGVGHVSIIVAPNSFVEWSGQNSASAGASNGTIAASYTGVAGTRLIYIDYAELVQLEVGSNHSSVRVHNNATYTAKGNMTWNW